MKLFQTLVQQLKKEPNFVTDNGELKKWVVLNKAQNFDEELIGLLLDNADLKEKFFVNVKGTLVFNQNLFVQFLEQKNYLNDSYTQFKNKVGLTIDGKYLKQRNEVALVWPFKDCILEGGQSREEDKREEIFFNEILAQDEITQLLEPKVLTNAKRYSTDGIHPVSTFNRNENGTITDNLIIKGNNLLALHTLKEEFAGKVKLIYIDPPYNTGKDGFNYNDSFNHSTWLTFIKNRLEIARQLLSKDGSIWVNLDDGEAHYLKVLCDDVFGRENFIANIVWEKSDSPRMDATYFSVRHDHILVFAKSKIDFKVNGFLDEEIPEHYNKTDESGRIYYTKPLMVMGGNESESLYFGIFAPDGTEVFPVKKDGSQGCWRWSKKKVEEESERIEWVNGKKGWVPYFRIYAENRIATPPETFWTHKEAGSNRSSKNEIRNLFGDNAFDTPKPEKLIERVIHIGSNENEIVLDYQLGSGTTAAVAHKMKRQYIGIEQMNYIETVAVERLKKVIKGEQGGISKSVNWQGGGSFVYLELKKFNQSFIEQIEEAKDTKALLQIWEQMKAKSFLNYNVDIKKQDEHLEDFKALSLAEQKQHLCELLDKNQLYVNLSSLNDADFACSEEEKRLNHDFYKIK
ncbi:MAG: site-specific DNA-methyltransferase [Bacteroidetes bacterium]|nr:site-specific DNA-methyltransferase [Bacteroidota bacterium]